MAAYLRRSVDLSSLMLTILVLFHVAGSASAQTGRCAENSVSTCLRPMFDNRESQYLLGYTSLETLYIVMATDKVTFKDWCSHSNAVQQCVTSLQPDCFVSTRNRLEGLMQVVRYICSQPNRFTDFDSYGKCLTSLKQRIAMEKCSRDFAMDQLNGLHEYWIFPNGTHNLNHVVEATCRASNKLLDCLHDAPRQACSDEAREWMREIYRLYLEPEASRKGCHLGVLQHKPEGFTTTQWIICISVVTIVILITITTAVICYRKRRSDGDSDSRSDPTVTTSATDADQYHVGPYPFGDLPDLPSSTGRMPNASPDLLEGAVGPALLPLEDQASGGYSHQNMINDKKEGVPPRLYDQDENDPDVIDAKPPPYTP